MKIWQICGGGQQVRLLCVWQCLCGAGFHGDEKLLRDVLFPFGGNSPDGGTSLKGGSFPGGGKPQDGGSFCAPDPCHLCLSQSSHSHVATLHRRFPRASYAQQHLCCYACCCQACAGVLAATCQGRGCSECGKCVCIPAACSTCVSLLLLECSRKFLRARGLPV